MSMRHDHETYEHEHLYKRDMINLYDASAWTPNSVCRDFAAAAAAISGPIPAALSPSASATALQLWTSSRRRCTSPSTWLATSPPLPVCLSVCLFVCLSVCLCMSVTIVTVLSRKQPPNNKQKKEKQQQTKKREKPSTNIACHGFVTVLVVPNMKINGFAVVLLLAWAVTVVTVRHGFVTVLKSRIFFVFNLVL